MTRSARSRPMRPSSRPTRRAAPTGWSAASWPRHASGSAVPITHVVVDAVHDESHVVVVEPADSRAPARERHTSRDLALLAVAGVLAILGSLISFVFYAVEAPDWLVFTWVLIFDLGFKVAAVVALWVLFQRRARADRLDL